MSSTTETPRTAAATEAAAEWYARASARDPQKLRKAARIVRAGRELGLVDDDLFPVDEAWR